MRSDPQLSRRAVLAGGALAALAGVAGCGLPSTNPAGALRDRLAEALAPTSPASAEMVRDRRTSLDPVAADWLPGWRIIDVLSRSLPHPRRFYVALSDSGRRAEILTGAPRAFSELLAEARVRVDSAGVAASVGAVYLDTTRDFSVWAYRIDRVQDITWLPRLSPTEETVRDRLIEAYRDRIGRPPATAEATGWLVGIWMVQGRSLVRHQLGIASGAPITDQATTLEQDIPVADSGR